MGLHVVIMNPEGEYGKNCLPKAVLVIIRDLSFITGRGNGSKVGGLQKLLNDGMEGL